MEHIWYHTIGHNIGHNSPHWRVVAGRGVMVGHSSTNHNSTHGRVVANVMTIGVVLEFFASNDASQQESQNTMRSIFEIREGSNVRAKSVFG